MARQPGKATKDRSRDFNSFHKLKKFELKNRRFVLVVVVHNNNNNIKISVLAYWLKLAKN